MSSKGNERHDMYQIAYTQQVLDKRADLSPERRDALDRAIALIAEDPYRKPSISRGDETRRSVLATATLRLDYAVLDDYILTVVTIALFDNTDVLIKDDED